MLSSVDPSEEQGSGFHLPKVADVVSLRKVDLIVLFGEMKSSALLSMFSDQSVRCGQSLGGSEPPPRKQLKGRLIGTTAARGWEPRAAAVRAFPR